MNKRKRSLSASGFLLAAAALLMLCAPPAHAHRVRLFATVEGNTINGYGYFPGGGRLKNSAIEVFGQNGEKLGELHTDQKGEFSFEARYRCDHLLIVDTGDGHRAEWTVSVDELPESLPLPGGFEAGPAAGDAARPGPLVPAAGATVAATGKKMLGETSASDMEEAVAEVVSKQIRPLREQLDQFENKIRLHDVLGGIGYIVGVSGIAFYFLAVRKIERHRTPEGSSDRQGGADAHI